MSANNEHEYPYPYPYYEEETGKVNCQICGSPYSIISPKHLKKHDITYKQYRLKFPDAPVTNEEFAIKSLYGRNKDMFKPKEEPEPDEFTLSDDSVIGDEEVVDEEIIKIQDFGIVEKDDTPLDPIAKMKKTIFNHLSMYLPNVRQNYFIQEKTLGGQTTCNYITDFADPVLKVNVEFPNTFWHNQDPYHDPLREEKLKDSGWKIIKIKGAGPSLKKIEHALQDIN